MTADSNRIGKKVRLILVGDRFYSGIILDENDLTLVIRDKFGSQVIIGKQHLISLEVLT